LLIEFEPLFATFIQAEMKTDLAHDYQHVLRVVKTAKKLCQQEAAEPLVVIPAAWLHDCLSLPKNHPQRSLASKMAADKAIKFLQEIHYPEQHHKKIHHAICCHSYSANITPETLEARIVQDADRLDALGAIGIARCLQVSSQVQRPLYEPSDPFCEQRNPDDKSYTLDHFYQKLLLIEDQIHCQSAKIEAKKRTYFMREYLAQLAQEIAD